LWGLVRRDLVLAGVAFIVIGLFLAFALPLLVASTNPVTRSYSVDVPPLALGTRELDLDLKRGDIVELGIAVRGGNNDIDLVVLDPRGIAILRTRVNGSLTTGFTAGMDGVYTLRLDNTFSIFTSKSVDLRVTVKPLGTVQYAFTQYVHPFVLISMGIGMAMILIGIAPKPSRGRGSTSTNVSL